MDNNVLCTPIIELWYICMISPTSILAKVAGFSTKLQLHIVYQPGQHNTAADVLSCISHSVDVGDSTPTVHHGLQSLDDPVVAV